jgi:release factor glutamine methyltransferase
MTFAAEYVTKVPGAGELRFATGEGIFQPTYTSELFIQALHKHPPKPGRFLDLGCGCGIVGIAAARMGLVRGALHGSDLSPKAAAVAAANARAQGIEMDGRSGSLLEPWKGMKFDVIVDDISGISYDVAKISPWFEGGVPCETGSDGTELTTAILDEVGAYLEPGGVLYFPVISLSAAPKIMDAAHCAFSRVERVARQQWMLPDSMKPHLPFLRTLKSQNQIFFDEKHGLTLCWTEIYKCSK